MPDMLKDTYEGDTHVTLHVTITAISNIKQNFNCQAMNDFIMDKIFKAHRSKNKTM